LRTTLGKIRLRYDRVTAVDALRLVAESFIATERGTPARSKFSHGGAAQIVDELPRHAGALACMPPRLMEVSDPLPISVEHLRNDPIVLALQRGSALALCTDQLGESGQ
jgi:hypothetical protein